MRIVEITALALLKPFEARKNTFHWKFPLRHLCNNNTRISISISCTSLPQITRDGRIVEESEIRTAAARKEHQRHAKELLASTIVSKAIEMEVRKGRGWRLGKGGEGGKRREGRGEKEGGTKCQD